MLDPTVSMLAFTESIGEVERSTAKATANWATKPKIRPGMTQSRPPMKVDQQSGDQHQAQIARPKERRDGHRLSVGNVKAAGQNSGVHVEHQGE